MSDTLFENYTAPSPTEIGTVGDINESEWEAVTWTTASGHTVSSVKILIFRKGVLTAHTVTVSVKATSSAQPTGADLCSVTYDPAALSTNAAGTTVEFVFGSPATLTTATIYAIVVRFSSGVTTGVNCLGMNGQANPGSGVANEKRNYSSDAGSNWTTAGSTFTYAVYGVSSTVDYTLTCGQGSYTLTGQVLAMTRQLRMTLDQGSYVLTGFALGMSPGYGMLCTMGSYVLTGFDLSFGRTWIMTLAQGSYTLTGQAINMGLSFTMALQTGYYTLTGFAAFFLGWFKRTKPSRGTYTPRTKPSIGSWTKRNKPSH